MPLLRCVDPECGYEWFEPSALAEGADCVECGGPTMAVGREEEPGDREELARSRGRESDELPRIAFAREAARSLLRRHGLDEIPVLVRPLASLEQLEIQESGSLPAGIRARLVGNTLEVAIGDAEVVKRFSIAHELGHHRMGTSHNQGRRVETEADAFAGELLVPGPKLLEALQATTDLRELAKMFQVSKQVLRIAAQQHRKGADLT
jgi:hypothetical protein